MAEQDNLKKLTAGTLKWNLIDRVLTQILYAVTGIVLAWLLSPADFGLVGAVLVFQAFASLLVDSGFSYALLQKKEPTHTDYSTVLWFNIFVSIFFYVLLYLGAPLIADCFEGDERLIPLSRVMFLSMILNAASIVQINRLMKRMHVRMVAVSNTLGLIAGAICGIYLAVAGFGPWAIVWQAVTISAVKTGVLWVTGHWLPELRFSAKVIKGFMGLSWRMMCTSFLNTLFLNIYSFFIGNRAGMSALGYYTQADKWSKMGITSISQVLTSSFLPVLAAVQDDRERYLRLCSKMNRFTAYLLFPCMCGLAVMATPIFHLLFGTKWDPSIILFQLLLFRGIFTVLNSLYNNYILALGNSKSILRLEILRDSVALVALFITLPFINMSTPSNPVFGLELLLWGQVFSSAVTYMATLVVTSRVSGHSVMALLKDLAPYIILTLLSCAVAYPVMLTVNAAWLKVLSGFTIFSAVYLGANIAAGSKIQKEIAGMVLKRKK
ncbi:MAG: lipopolysaccharide biosynthesis protein [Muribaculaceae bacterium]|nr:lipopolysaccharide biosynthesis protein [Muribaculaceae bacterium]